MAALALPPDAWAAHTLAVGPPVVVGEGVAQVEVVLEVAPGPGAVAGVAGMAWGVPAALVAPEGASRWFQPVRNQGAVLPARVGVLLLRRTVGVCRPVGRSRG